MLLYICIYNQFKRKQIIGKTTNFSAIKNSRTKKFVKVKISKIKVSIFNKYEVLIMIRIFANDLVYIRFGKQVIISKEDENINLLFEYKEKQCLNEFGIHVINVVYDGRSLIDQQEKDTKKRLYYLCDKLFETFNQYEPNYDGPILKKVKK